MKIKPVLAFLFFVSSMGAFGQSKTTEALQKKHSEALALFFYNNTLRMLNQEEDPALDDLIKDIEKLKFLMIRKTEEKFGANGYKDLVKDYKAEQFEEIMTSRFEGKNFDIFVKEKDGKTKAMLVLVNDKDNLFVLDILGSINVSKVTQLYSTLDKSADIGKRIHAFTDGDDGENGHNGRDSQ